MVLSPSCFAMETRGSARHSSRKKEYSAGREEGGLVLINYGNSSLVVDRLCDQARGQSTSIACFYFDWDARNEQLAIGVLGSLLKQMVSGMERIPEEVSQAFQGQRVAIGGRGPQLADIVKMLQSITSSQPTFLCIDGLDGSAGVQQLRVLGSLKQILDKSPATRIFLTGRLYIRDEVEKSLVGQVVSVPIAPTKSDIVEYLRARLGEDETQDAMDESLKVDILDKIPQNISEMCVGAMGIRTSLHIIG